MDNDKWIFTISFYSAENMMKTRQDLVKAKPEPKKEEAKNRQRIVKLQKTVRTMF